jgi:chaperonin GroEL
MKAKQKPGVVFQPNVHQSLQRGIRKIVNAIRPTLGPISGGVAIDHIHKSKSLPEYLNDGGTIARRIIELPNRNEDMGAMLARSMILRQHERIGDGTATVAVLFEAIFDAGLRYIAAGGNAMQIRRHFDSAISLILADLDRMTFPLDGQIPLTNMARSLCHDDALAALFGEAFDLVGPYGRLEIREDYARGVRREFVEGTYYHAGLFSKALIQDEAAPNITLENPAIFLCDFEVDDHRTLFAVLQAAHGAGIKNLVIIARSLSDKAVSLLVANNKLGAFKVLAVKLPGLNPTDRMAALDDLSILTGAKAVLKVTGDSLENVTADHFGQARRLWADMRVFGIVGGKGNPRQLREHIHTVQTHHHQAHDVDERKRTQERISNLMGGSVTIWVGGFTEPEIKARKSQAEHTALTMRAAMEEGVVAGGGIALLNCRKKLELRLADAQDTDERAAYRILIEALAAPARTIFHNAGYDPSEIIAQISYEGPQAGFDVVANRVVNICEAGILDSALMLKTSVRNAISTAGIALTIDSLVHLANPEIVARPE